MRFTIVTPVLNGAAWLGRTLGSVGAQTCASWSHIVVDGGSRDGTVEIVKEAALADPRVRLIEAPGDNIYTALFRGFEAADGDWLGWLNADDLYAPWALETVAEHAAATGCRWLTGLPGWWDDRGRLRAVRSRAWAPRGLIRRGWFHERFLGCLQQESMFFARALFEELTPEERGQIAGLRLAGDFQLWRRFAERAELSVLPVLLSGFRMHGANASRANAETYEREVAALDAPALPRWMIRPARALYGALSAHMTRRAAERALARLAAEVEGRGTPRADSEPA
jgi:glycosyltransferase involved in cell wall biosynthesis